MFNIGLAYEVSFSSLSPMVIGRQDHRAELGRRCDNSGKFGRQNTEKH